MRLKLWATTLVAVAALAGAAQAGDASCIWNGLGQSSRDAWLADYDARGSEALNENTFSEEELSEALTDCGVTEEAEALIAGEALGGYALQQAAGRWLQLHANLTAQKLDQAWGGFAPQVRNDYETWVLALMKDPEAAVPVPEAAVGAILKGLGVSDGATARHVAVYYSGRVVRLNREPAF
ncbi:hypothetical protein [Caulobacter sp. 17J65-9]|uniref:hypothetical protein n=1 Tax=Caulobacter sp. 17J65-9 TaxID=2709382 RepID=UPI0013CB8635|nr:hypothetical protein [Caulobacter sp. 17J65-9]NEX92421.1 hypothetical protein [Caulobacter sp. 17J65-9]